LVGRQRHSSRRVPCHRAPTGSASAFERRHRLVGRSPYPTSMRRVLVVLVLLTLLTSACGRASGTASTHRASGARAARRGSKGHPARGPLASPVLRWHTCDSRFQCATLPVPISYRDPALGTIPMAVVRLPAGDDQRGALDVVINPGGPGASGVSFLEKRRNRKYDMGGI